MVCVASQPKSAVAAWHQAFLAMLPAIVTHARISFRHLNPEARDEAIQETVCNACCAFARLAELDKLDLAYPTVLARYAVAQVRDGRKVGGKLNVRDVLSPYCQRCKKIVVERLDQYDEEEDAWREVLIEDRHAGPAQTAAARLDLALWFKLMAPKDRRIAKALAAGDRTGNVASKFGVSAGRISQKRREFMADWQRLQGDAA